MLGIVILNYKTWNETLDCIKSIDKHIGDINYRVYVVDNASPNKPDEETLGLLTGNPRVELIMHDENKGYSAGNNVGLKAALRDECEYVLICNSDILFVDDSINKMISFLVENNNVGIVGPQVYNGEGVFQPLYMKCRLTGMGKIKNMCLHTKLAFLGRRFEKKFIQRTEIEEPMKMFGTSGCCFMMSKECLQYLYPLDERTFLYEEEYIIGAILEKSKFDIYVIPNTHVIHNHSVSIGGISKFSYKCMMDSEQIYLKYYIKSLFIMRKTIWLIRKVLLKRIKQ